MAIRKVATGWQVDIQPAGRGGKRIRKTFPRKVQAEQFELEERTKAVGGNYKVPVKDRRTLVDISNAWYKYHGHSLKSGQNRLLQLIATAKALGNPIATSIDAKDFLLYREKRIAEGITPNHMNHELAYLKSAFNELIRINEWQLANPYGRLKKLKIVEPELSFLSFAEIQKLLSELEASRNPDAVTIARICLSIGCRWGEAEKLRGEQVHGGKIHLHATKNGRNRSVPIAVDLEQEIFTGRGRRGRLFGSSRAAFANALERAEIELPRSQLTHVLRHTFASHFMMSGGNLLDLNKILGHQTIQMTMRYAHLSPEHLAEAVKRNPLSLALKKRKAAA